ISGSYPEKLQTLLAFLCLHYDQTLSRQQVAVQLWTETTDTEAKANLRRRIYDLRRVFPKIEQVLEIKAKTLRWIANSSCSIDIILFQEAIKEAEREKTANNQQKMIQYWEKAVNLYQGDVYPDCYDDWIIPLREELKEKVIYSYEQLIQGLKEGQEREKGIQYAQKYLRIDPLSEKAYCYLMELYGKQGDRSSALRVYHQCMTLLREELGVSPSPTTCQLYEKLLTLEDTEKEKIEQKSLVSSNYHDEDLERQKIKKNSSQSNHPIILSQVIPTSNIPLIGREKEYEALNNWKKQQGESCPLLMLVGESGVGKTRLLEEIAHQIQSESGYVLWGRSFEAEKLRPYGIWLDALRSLPNNSFSAELEFLLLDSAYQTVNTANRSRIFDVGIQLIEHLTSQIPLILILLDDIQWLDQASIAFLHYAIRLLNNRPVLFAATAQKQALEHNQALSQLLADFHREQRLQQLQIEPLNEKETLNLAQHICPKGEKEKIFADSGGNPLFTIELARALTNGTSSSNLTSLIEGSFLKLSENTRNLLYWAATLGSSFKTTTLAEITNDALPQLLTMLEELEQQRIIRPENVINQESYYTFAHDIVRQVAYKQLSEPRRRLFHTHIAQTLEKHLNSYPDEINNVAYHASLGGEGLLAASASLTASERHLRLFAYHEAAQVAQKGISHCQSLETNTRITLHLKLLRVYVKTGISKEKMESLEKELKQLIDEASLRGLKDAEAIGLESLIILSYDHHRLTQVQQHSLAAAERGRFASPATQAYMLAQTGACLAEIGRDIPRAEALLLEAQGLSERLGLQTIDVCLGLGIVYRFQGKIEEASELLQKSWQQSQSVQDHWRECLSLTNLVMLALEEQKPEVALDYGSELITVSAQMGEGSEVYHAAALDALARYLLEERESFNLLEGSLQSLKSIDSPRMLAYIQTIAAQWDLEQGNLQQALTRATEALLSANSVNNHSEQVLASGILIETMIQLERQTEASEYYEQLQQINPLFLSWKAKTTLNQLNQQFSVEL
ncbi:MAG: BTAD domain-containing putative transcriptional regulator, partial [Microcystaceae cyanobacterium]